MDGSSSAASGARTAAPPRPVVEPCPDNRLLSAAALRLSKHEVAATLATASTDGTTGRGRPSRRRGSARPRRLLQRPADAKVLRRSRRCRCSSIAGTRSAVTTTTARRGGAGVPPCPLRALQASAERRVQCLSCSGRRDSRDRRCRGAAGCWVGRIADVNAQVLVVRNLTYGYLSSWVALRRPRRWDTRRASWVMRW